MAIDNLIRLQDTRRRTVGMLIVGGGVWLAFLIFINGLAMVGIHHSIAEALGMPLTWICNYTLNSWLNFKMPWSLQRFAVFCSIASGGWVVLLSTTVILVDVIGISASIAVFAGIFTMTGMNLLFHQLVTFNATLRVGFRRRG